MKQHISYTTVCIISGVTNSDFSTMKKGAKKMKSMSQAEDLGDPKLAMKQRSQERPLWCKQSIYTYLFKRNLPPAPNDTEGRTEWNPARTFKQDIKQHAYLHSYFSWFNVKCSFTQ